MPDCSKLGSVLHEPCCTELPEITGIGVKTNLNKDQQNEIRIKSKLNKDQKLTHVLVGFA